jgi:hypothetical protein
MYVIDIHVYVFIAHVCRSKYEKFDLKEEYKKREGGKDVLNLVVIGRFTPCTPI